MPVYTQGDTVPLTRPLYPRLPVVDAAVAADWTATAGALTLYRDDERRLPADHRRAPRRGRVLAV